MQRVLKNDFSRMVGCSTNPFPPDSKSPVEGEDMRTLMLGRLRLLISIVGIFRLAGQLEGSKVPICYVVP